MPALPFSDAQRMLPLIPERLQRFVAVKDWRQAENLTRGYAFRTSLKIDELDCAEPRIKGHGGRELELIEAVGVAIASLDHEDQNGVADLGGHFGFSAELIESAFPGRQFLWTLVEPPEVVDLVRQLVRIGTSFTSELRDVLHSTIGISLASASLIYVAEPYAAVDAMLEKSLCAIFIRIPLWPIRSDSVAIGTLRGELGGGSYPTWCFSEHRFSDHVAQNGEISLRFEVQADRAYFKGRNLEYQRIVLVNRLGV